MKKSFIFAIISLVFIAGLGVLSFYAQKGALSPAANLPASVSENITSPTAPTTPGTIQKSGERNPAAATATASPENTFQIPVLIGNASYHAAISNNGTVYDAMLHLASTTSFAMDTKYFSGLGYFIESINGVPNANGAYWTLYVNGAYSPVGASARVLEPGDTIEWRYEKL